jgi:hypothetical protein
MHKIGLRMTKLTRNTKVVECHSGEPRINFPMIPPPRNGVPDLFNSLGQILIYLVGFLNAVHGNVKEVSDIWIIT